MTSQWRPLADAEDTTQAGFFVKDWGAYRPSRIQRLLIALTQKTVLQRGFMREKMARLIMAFGRPLDIRFRDCNYRIDARNNLIETGILTRPIYNGEEIDFLAGAVEDNGVAVDIGCNIGLYTLPLAKSAGPSGQVIAIDANPTMLRHLTFNAKASALNNVVALNLAVGGRDSRANLQIRLDNVAIVSVEESDTGTVRMRPLLRILEDAGVTHLDSLKIDIEGHEDAAMEPFLQHAPEAMLPSRIVIERMNNQSDYPGCTREFARLGYRLVGQTRNNSMYLRDQSAIRKL